MKENRCLQGQSLTIITAVAATEDHLAQRPPLPLIANHLHLLLAVVAAAAAVVAALALPTPHTLPLPL